MKTTLFNRLTAGLLAAVLCLSVLAGCAAKPQKELTRYSTIFYDVFDTVTQVIAYCESEEDLQRLRRRGECENHQRQRRQGPRAGG